MGDDGSKTVLYDPLHLPYPHTVYDGVPVPRFMTEERIKELNTVHQSRADDVYIATYPKSGTTWLQNVVNEIMGRPQGDYEKISDGVPWLENKPQDVIDNLKSPRLLKTHFKWEWVPKADGVKYINCYRNPKDVAVSYYYHLKNFNMVYKYKPTFEEFMKQIFLPRVGVEYGYYFDHVAGWLSQQDNPNVLFLTFEDMVEDLPREIKRIGQFLNIQLEQDRIQEIASSGSFAVMKEAKKFDYNWITGGESNFIRKGKVGDWKNYFSEEQSEEIEFLVEKYLKPLGARIRYILPDDNTDKKSLL